MNKELVRISKTLFATYVGLAASGYDMADCKDEDVRMIIVSIRKEKWPVDVIKYFSKARTGRCEVNPYWPMASMLSTASLRMHEDSLVFNDKDVLVDFIRSLDNISAEEKGTEGLEWILMLPDILVHVVSHSQFEVMWSNYQGILAARTNKYENVLSNIDALLVSTLGISYDGLPKFFFIPNLLQAPYIADYEVVNGRIGIIQNIPSMMGVIHEALHILLKPYRKSILKGLKSIPVHLIADINKMKSIGYA